MGLGGGLNVYGFTGGDPVNFSDPFGLCPCSAEDFQAVVNGVAQRVAPWKPIIEVAGTIETAPLAGGMGMTAGISTEALEIGAAFRAAGTRLAAQVRLATLLAKARGARDALSEALSKLPGKSRPATVTAGYNTETGEIAACASGGGSCAEDHVVEALGGDPSKVKFTEAVRPRTGEQVPICEKCQASYGQDAFPTGTPFKP